MRKEVHLPADLEIFVHETAMFYAKDFAEATDKFIIDEVTIDGQCLEPI